MKRLILLSSILLVTACGGMHTSHTQKHIANIANAETRGWEQVTQGMAECPHGTKGQALPRAQSLDFHHCWQKLVSTHVQPVAMAPDFLREFIIERRRLAIDYKKGKVDRDEGNLMLEELWNEYVSKIEARSRGALQQAYNQDLALQQNMQNLSREIREDELERYKAQQQALQNNRIRNTNCYGSGNHMNCTTW